MRRDTLETLVGGALLLAAAFFVYTAFASSGVSAVEGYRLDAEFDDASGVVPGTEVRLAGVKVGTVVAKHLAPDGRNAIVTLTVDERFPIPADSQVRILPDGLLGGSYISLEPGGSDEIMANGTLVGFEQTQGAINVVDLLARFVTQAAEGGGAAAPQ